MGLVAIGVFTLVSGFLVSNLLGRQESDRALITAARNQSALALEAAVHLEDATSAETDDDRTTAIARLQVAITSLGDIRTGLLEGSTELNLSGSNSIEVQKLFASFDNTFTHLEASAEMASIDAGSVDPADFQQMAVLYSFGMDAIANQYEEEAAARAESTRTTHLGLVAATLALLLLEGLLVVRPALVAARRSRLARTERHAEERAQDRKKLDFLSQFDSLTGLPNRGLFMDRLNQAMHRAHREGGVATVMTLNLDEFKTVNERHGFEAGDRLLKMVAERIESKLRDSDTVGRLGADQFGIILASRHRAEHAASVAEKLLEVVAKPYQMKTDRLVMTAGMGIAVYPLDGDDVNGLVRDAETAMAAAKQAGPNKYEFVTASLREQSRQRLNLLDNLRKALDRPHELRLVYQPKIDVATGQINGVEALLRWDHPDMGLVMPGDFIPIAEQSDLMVPLGDWVINEATRQARVWEDEDADKALRIAINVSPRQFKNGDLVEKIADALERSGLDASKLEVELTEGTLIEDTEQAMRTIERLKEMGVRISIDDFGTGYSSLSYLKRLPIDTLKIDRSFVADITEDRGDAAISEAIVSLGRSLHLEVVAEGVETRAQYAYVEALGCDTVQGFLFSKPLDPKDLDQLLAAYERQPSPFGVN